MENHLNRKLGKNEVVHHINGNRKDNRIDNLVVMTREEHSRMHHKEPVYIDLICQFCKQPFQKRYSEYKHRVKGGQTEFCCSKRCAGKLLFSKGVAPPIYKGNRIDQFDSGDDGSNPSGTIMNKMTDSICPKCGYPQYCGCCESCRRRIPEGIHPYTWTEDGECIRCANCGFTAHVDQWMEIDAKQAK